MSYPSPDHHDMLHPRPSPPMKVEQVTSATAWMEHPAYPQLYRPAADVYRLTKQIVDLPLLRPLTLREGREIAFLHNPSHGLKNYKVALAYQRGKVQAQRCSCCAGPNPMGPFQYCVVLGTVQNGSCTNCAYNGNGIRCTLRVQNSDGTSVNSKSVSRQAAIRRQLTVDQTPKEIIDIENGIVEDLGRTQRAHTAVTAEPESSSKLGFMRRQAATDAESKMSTYTYGGMDVGGSAIPSSEMGSQVTDLTSVEGWPDFVLVSAGPHKAEAERPSRDGFMARRGGKNSHASMKPRASEGHSGISKRSKTAALEDSDESEDDRPLIKRGRAHANLSQEDDEAIPPATAHTESSSETCIVPDNLALTAIPCPPKTSTIMKLLLQMKPLRNLVWKEDYIRNMNLKHNYKIEAGMGFCVGNIAPSPCGRCLRGSGAFGKCVVVKGHFQQSCANCTYYGKSSLCSFHVPNSTKNGVVLVASSPSGAISTITPPIISPAALALNKGRPVSQQPISRSSTNSDEAAIPTPGFSHSKIVGSSSNSKTDGVHGTKMRPDASKQLSVPEESLNEGVTAPKAVLRSQRYLKALNEAQQMGLEEQLLEVAELKFRLSVITNVIDKSVQASNTSRYKTAQIEFEAMSFEEQQLELAGLKFQLSVMQDAVTTGEGA